MTNAQAALIAAATLYTGNERARGTEVLEKAERWKRHLDALDARDAAQQATTAPQADELPPTRCATCQLPIEASMMQPGAWRDATGLWGNGDHDHQP